MTQQGKNAIDLVLAESLIELSAKKPIDKITIKEITDKAGVIRPTFYNHFQDKYELIEWIIKTELLEPIKPLLNAGMIFEAIVLMLNNISANSVFYKKALKLEGAVTFNQIAMKCVCEMFMNIISEKSTGKKLSIIHIYCIQEAGSAPARPCWDRPCQTSTAPEPDGFRLSGACLLSTSRCV